MKTPSVTSLPLFAVFIFCTVWAVLTVAAPLMVPSDTLVDLSGVVGGHENEDQFDDLSAIPHAVYWLGDAECHQLANRSFFLNGNQMPFCARDVGIFVGVAVGFGVASFIRYKIHPLIALAGLVPIAIDGGLQAVTSYESNNILRVVTGLIAGLALSLLIAHFMLVLQEDSRKKRSAGEGKPGQE
ncbi:MAG: DUF2085 domain-containing protein [Thermoplasmata archaeon]|jgi:uncharacterized membrane protein|nr:DUF2085 domain-containing protein [Thermoplasmata archaeon]